MNRDGVLGVAFVKSKNRWNAYIGFNCKIISLGSFNTKQEAIKIRKQAEKEYFGEFAYKEDFE